MKNSGKYENNLPIDVSIKYSLDGKEMNLDDMLGLSGKVSITVSYKNNDKHIVRVNGKSETLYTPFVVMFGTVLDNETNMYGSIAFKQNAPSSFKMMSEFNGQGGNAAFDADNSANVNNVKQIGEYLNSSTIYE